MRISDTEVKKILEGRERLVEEIVEIGDSADQIERDKPLIDAVVADVIAMPDREEMIANLKARIEAGEYNPTGDEIADTMIRRSIADRVR